MPEHFYCRDPEGQCRSQRNPEIEPTGKLAGDITVAKLSIGDGAVFNGVCKMQAAARPEEKNSPKRKEAGHHGCPAIFIEGENAASKPAVITSAIFMTTDRRVFCKDKVFHEAANIDHAGYMRRRLRARIVYPCTGLQRAQADVRLFPPPSMLPREASMATVHWGGFLVYFVENGSQIGCIGQLIQTASDAKSVSVFWVEPIRPRLSPVERSVPIHNTNMFSTACKGRLYKESKARLITSAASRVECI